MSEALSDGRPSSFPAGGVFRAHGSLLWLARTAYWTVPHLTIWAAAAGYVWYITARDECQGFCALYSAVLTYSAIALAILLSAIVAAVQLVSLALGSRRSPAPTR